MMSNHNGKNTPKHIPLTKKVFLDNPFQKRKTILMREIHSTSSKTSLLKYYSKSKSVGFGLIRRIRNILN